MAHDAPFTPGGSQQSRISITFGLIADSLEWECAPYQAFMARLSALGKDASDLTLGEISTAYAATLSTMGRDGSSPPRGLQ